MRIGEYGWGPRRRGRALGRDPKAAAVTLKGLTAQYLLRQTYRVQPGDPVLVHAAADGMGLILCQWARHLGAVVIGTVSTAPSRSGAPPAPQCSCRSRHAHPVPAGA